MRTLDSIQVKGLSKLVLTEDAGVFSVSAQAINRPLHPLCARMTREAAKAFWRKECVGYFYNATKNMRDAMKMADRRCAMF